MKILLTADQIQQRVDELARQIKADYGNQPVTIVGVLTGCLMFLADLVRRLDLPLRIALIQASSYRGTATTPGELRVQLGPGPRPARPPRPAARRHPRHRPHAGLPGQALACPGARLAQDRRSCFASRAGRRCHRARLLRLRHPRRLRGRLRPRLQRRVPPPAPPGGGGNVKILYLIPRLDHSAAGKQLTLLVEEVCRRRSAAAFASSVRKDRCPAHYARRLAGWNRSAGGGGSTRGPPFACAAPGRIPARPDSCLPAAGAAVSAAGSRQARQTAGLQRAVGRRQGTGPARPPALAGRRPLHRPGTTRGRTVSPRRRRRGQDYLDSAGRRSPSVLTGANRIRSCPAAGGRRQAAGLRRPVRAAQGP